ncbi:leukocyte cell-derived chemotaxin-2 [Gadus morhua]|uniref:Leukocyte cell derived chemotaxin 2, tandem duplicate 1 n=1 Tax=Gadus morhua TaxID=8049 RepID=A0A8C5CN57_GADMO|nr:leukocyte cell-derived chemotaxin-2-like [Gadus morhua]
MKTALTCTLLLVVLGLCESVQFGPLCSGNSANTRRSSDRHGEGRFGAQRQGRTHKGLDILCSDGSNVLAPFDVQLNGKLTVYADPTNAQTAINKGINLRGEGLCFKLFYVDPVQTTGTIRKGQKIGTMLPMQTVYPGIQSHVHVQMCDKSDPTPHF